MKYSKEELVDYRLGKAKNCLEEAGALAKIDHWDAVANRLYYACYYAISAYLVKEEINVFTHKGIKSAFHNELIKTGLADEEKGKFFSDLFNKRQEADYKDFVNFEQEVIEPLMNEAKEFVEFIKEITEK